MTTTQRVDLLRDELRGAISALAQEDGDFTVADDVRVFRRSAPTALNHGESSISYCAIGQGAKHVEVGEHRYVYGPDHILITSIELPMISHVVEATEERPYLSMTLDLNPGMVRSVILATDPSETSGNNELCAFRVAPMETALLDATIRLMKTVGNPGESEFLAPMIKREIIFRLLMTSHAGRMHQIAGMSMVSNQIKSALERLRERYCQPLLVADIAGEVGMSVSSFHEHFKKVTGLTPLQYQKQLRLREARRLLVTEGIDAAEAGFSVGYTDASHFNRDYKRMFGLPPMRDVEQLREATHLAKAS